VQWIFWETSCVQDCYFPSGPYDIHFVGTLQLHLSAALLRCKSRSSNGALAGAPAGTSSFRRASLRHQNVVTPAIKYMPPDTMSLLSGIASQAVEIPIPMSATVDEYGAGATVVLCAGFPSPRIRRA
jgi:hypothetical protein